MWEVKRREEETQGVKKRNNDIKAKRNETCKRKRVTEIRAERKKIGRK